MATVHAKDTYFELNSTDLSDQADTLALNRALALAEDTAFQDSAESFVPGIQGTTITVSGHWDGASNKIDEELHTAYVSASAIAWVYGPENNTSSNVKYSGNCWVSDYSVESSVSDIVKFSATLVVTGGVTRGTFA